MFNTLIRFEVFQMLKYHIGVVELNSFRETLRNSCFEKKQKISNLIPKPVTLQKLYSSTNVSSQISTECARDLKFDKK